MVLLYHDLIVINIIKAIESMAGTPRVQYNIEDYIVWTTSRARQHIHLRFHTVYRQWHERYMSRYRETYWYVLNNGRYHYTRGEREKRRGT